MALSEFYEEWKEEPLVVLKWLQLVATSAFPGNVTNVQNLLEHPAFIITNPNSCYSVFLGFARSTPNFHAADGSGYDFMANSILKVIGPLAGTSFSVGPLPFLLVPLPLFLMDD